MNFAALSALVRRDIRLFILDRKAVMMSAVAPIVIASFFGFLFGGFKVAMGKLFPNTVLDRTHAEEFIRLNLR